MSDTNDSGAKRKPSASYAFLILCGAFMITGVMILVYLGSKPPAAMQGKLMPNMTLEALANADKPFSSNDLLGKKTLFLLWSPSSKACQDQVSNLSGLLQTHAEWKLTTVAFAEKGAPEPESLRSEVEQFLSTNQLQWPVFTDQTGRATMELTLLMPDGSLGFPTLLFVDQEARVIQVVESQNAEGWKQLDTLLRTSR